MTAPRATVRLQLHAGFTLDDALAQVPYYASLGVSHLYLSPISTARPGSTHGYDVIDHSQVNPELGGIAALTRLADGVRANGMGLLLDIVPNHMATHQGNRWWWDVLSRGRASDYADWLDIDWDSPVAGLQGKVLAPFLDQPYPLMLASGRISLQACDGGYRVVADGVPYPLAAASLPLQVGDAIYMASHYDHATALGRQHLHQLLERQHYRLAWWRCAADMINWRRFFQINDLIGVRVEYQPVFDAVHQLSLRLYAQGVIDGLRIDHVDGLAWPLTYCRQLYAALSQCHDLRPGSLRDGQPWLIVEKILATDEVLDERWQVAGTTGYDFMDQVGAWLHCPQGAGALSQHWASLAKDARPVADYIKEARWLILHRHFMADRNALLLRLTTLAQHSPDMRDVSDAALGRALGELLIAFPIYRTYVAQERRDGTDRHYSQAHAAARTALTASGDQAGLEALTALSIWLGSYSIALQRFQQLTPPLAAKSLEDTVFYRYGRLLSRNEVGSCPDVFSLPTDALHQRGQWRASHAPLSLLATATHDHKRGEDLRARLAVLSEVTDVWVPFSQRWLDHCAADTPACDARQTAERYMLLQTLVGAWPPTLQSGDSQGLNAYALRLVQWQTKALREAKQHSGWLRPNLVYEQQSADLVMGLLCGDTPDMVRELACLVEQIAPAGVVNSLAQTVLRLTMPGVPDLYQGCEFWDFSLVDPDNRQPVDFVSRLAALQRLQHMDQDIATLLAGWRNGHVKQAVIAQCLQLRLRLPQVFRYGSYQPLHVLGQRKDHVLAFIRVWRDHAVVVVVPHCCAAGLATDGVTSQPGFASGFWGDTHVVLPAAQASHSLRHVLTGDTLLAPDGHLPVAAVLKHFPVAVVQVTPF
ncbi:MAG: malto-oligosyltrehalose synthase [Burkholderiaceae bacterium]|nr:malto-oligosyltrehalose synthase [Burkholderiaceae bacterium]